MTVSKDGRTTTDRKYRPIRREASRYGKIESALRHFKEKNKPKPDGRVYVDPQAVAKRIKILDTQQVKAILHFTEGVKKDPEVPSLYYFTDEEIRVDAGW